MGNYASLTLAYDKEENSRLDFEKHYISPKYIIPLFWTAFFKVEHIVTKDIEGGAYYYFEVTKADAMSNFEARMHFFFKWYGQEVFELSKEFFQSIFTFDYTYIMLDVDDILGMSVEYPATIVSLQQVQELIDCFDDSIDAIEQKMLPSLDDINEDLNSWLVGLDDEYP